VLGTNNSLMPVSKFKVKFYNVRNVLGNKMERECTTNFKRNMCENVMNYKRRVFLLILKTSQCTCLVGNSSL